MKKKTSSNAHWMRDGKFGLMVHWLAPGPEPEHGLRETDLNRAVDAFDVDRFLGDFKASGADWMIFTIGQNTGYYASPNAVLDRLAGPGRTPRRDLVMEIATRVKALGKRFVAYLPCEVAGQSAEIKTAFGWTDEKNTAQTEFQRRYTEFIRDYAQRFGSRLDGWWFDGAYQWDCFHSKFIDAALFFGAARAGNPHAAITFNDGSFCCGFSLPVVPGQDYLSGEVEVMIEGKVKYGRDKRSPLLVPATHTPQPPPDCLWHALVPIDCFWAHGNRFGDWLDVPFAQPPIGPGEMEPPVYATADLATVVRDFKSAGGGVTFNVGIFQKGGLGERTVAQLAALTKAVSSWTPGAGRR